MGGMSIESEVSFNSGRTVCDHIDATKYEVVPLFQKKTRELYILPWYFLHRGKISDFEHRLESEAERITWDTIPARVDFVFIAQHGRYAEDGCLQGTLEVLGVPYLGAKVLGAALGMDKFVQKEWLALRGIDVAKGFVIRPQEINTLEEKEVARRLEVAGIFYPVVVKPVHEGSSLGVSIVNSYDELVKAVFAAAHIDEQRVQQVLVEEKLVGTEFTVISLERYEIINGEIKPVWHPLSITEVVTNDGIFDYEQKYMPGRAQKHTPARLLPELIEAINEVVVKASEALQFKTESRIDGFVTIDGRIVIVDVNPISGMGPASFIFDQAAESGLNPSALLSHILETEMMRYGFIEPHDQKIHYTSRANSGSKIRVAVLMGGDSNEREVSLESGRNVCYKLSPEKYEAIPVFVDDAMKLHCISERQLIKPSTRAIKESLTPDQYFSWSKLSDIADFVFIGLHGGRGENGSVQGMLETLGIPYNGSGPRASALCIDKHKTNALLAHCGIAVPRNELLAKKTWASFSFKEKEAKAREVANHFGFPLIVKPHDDGCSVFVSRPNTADELVSCLDEYFTTEKDFALIEEYIQGMELTCGVIGNDEPRALPPSKAVSRGEILSMEEKFLPGAGENQTPAPLHPGAMALVKKVMESVYSVLGCKGYVRIDCFYQTAEQSPTGSERVVVLEVNNLPAMTPATCIFHQAAEIGLRPMEFVDKIITFGFELHAKEQKAKITEVIHQASLFDVVV